MWWIVAIVVVSLVGIGLGVGLVLDGPGRSEAASLTWTSPDFGELHDGTYVGAYHGTKSHLRDTELEIVVHDGNLAGVKVLKGAVDKEGKPAVLAGGKSIDDLFASVVAERTLDVDVISGATITTKTHLKALEDALLKAR